MRKFWFHPSFLILHPLLLSLLFAAGCFPNKPAHSTAYFGPTESLAQVASAINTNNSQIPTLWARIGYFEADVRDQRGSKSQFVNGSSGYLMLRKNAGQQEIRLRANKAGIGTVMDVGANAENVWLVAPPADKAWWARRKNIGKPCMDAMPIDPLAVMEVLGISEINPDFLRPPFPIMRFNNDRDAYMLIWASPSADSPQRWLARREVWYDRKNKLPELVNLFDEHGRIVVSAYLSQHKQITGTTAKLATRFQLFFPDTDSHFTFTLDDVKLNNGSFPNDRSFIFNPAHTGVNDVQQMDGNCP